MKNFMKKFAFTSSMAFTLISFAFILLYAMLDDDPVKFERYVFFRYILGKFFCILLFSLSLGAINRISELQKPKKIIKRIFHFALASISYIIFMILLFLSIFESDALSANKGVSLYLVFFVIYLFSVLIGSIFKKRAEKSKPEEYKPMVEEKQD